MLGLNLFFPLITLPPLCLDPLPPQPSAVVKRSREQIEVRT